MSDKLLCQTAVFLLFSLFAENALAAQITAQPPQGPAGTSAIVTGAGWPPGNLIELAWDFNYRLTMARVKANPDGTFSTVIVTPGGAVRATYVDAGDQAAFLTAQAPFKITSAAGVDDYPEPLCRPEAIDAVIDQWDFFNRECTSFVAWRLNRAYGFPAAFTNNFKAAHFGHAYQWYDAATSLGILVDGIPLPGDVAQFPPNTAGALGVGHVAWVESVNTDGSITIEDYNFLGTGVYDRRNVSASDVSRLNFIHFGEWFASDLQPQEKKPPVIQNQESFREGVLVFFRLFFTDPNNDAIGFGFRGIKGSGWAEENLPFSSPSYGRMSGSTPVDIGAQKPKSTSIAIEYPFNHLCGTQSAYESDVEAWIYDRAGLRSPAVQIHLTCSAQGKAHLGRACAR